MNGTKLFNAGGSPDPARILSSLCLAARAADGVDPGSARMVCRTQIASGNPGAERSAFPQAETDG